MHYLAFYAGGASRVQIIPERRKKVVGVGSAVYISTAVYGRDDFKTVLLNILLSSKILIFAQLFLSKNFKVLKQACLILKTGSAYA